MLSGLFAHQLQIGRHSDRDEEQPQQQALERLDVGLELVAEFTVGEQYAGQKCAQGQRQAHLADEQRGADDHQQSGGRECLGDARRGDDPQHGAQHVAAADHGGREHGDELDRQPAARARGLGGGGTQQRQQGERRQHGDVLKQ